MSRKTSLKNPAEIPHNIVSFVSFCIFPPLFFFFFFFFFFVAVVTQPLFRVFRGPNELVATSIARVIKSTFVPAHFSCRANENRRKIETVSVAARVFREFFQFLKTGRSRLERVSK